MRNASAALLKRARELASKTYPFIVTEAEGEFEVTFPDLRGCRTSGKSLEEALGNIDEAKLTWVEGTLICGGHVPEPSSNLDYSGRFVVRCGRSLHKAISQTAALEGVSQNQFVVEGISEKLGFQTAKRAYHHEAEKLMSWLSRPLSKAFWELSGIQVQRESPLRALPKKPKAA